VVRVGEQRFLSVLPDPGPPRPHEALVVRRLDQHHGMPVAAPWPVYVGREGLSVAHRNGRCETVKTGVGGDNPVLGRQRGENRQRKKKGRLSHQPTIIDESRYNSDCSQESRSSSSRWAPGASFWFLSSFRW